MSWVSHLVRYLVLGGLVLGLVMFVRAKMPETQVGESFVTCARFRDGARLTPGSPVLIAGVRVGEITRVTVEGAVARVDMLLEDETDIPLDSWVTKRRFSLFGDSYIEIIPAAAEPGAPTAQRLKSGQCLTRVLEGASTDQVLRTLAERVMPSVDRGAERMHEAATYGRKWASSALEEGVLDVEAWLSQGHVESPLGKADQALARLEAATTGAAATMASGRPGIDRTLARIETGVASARRQIADLSVTLKDASKRATAGFDGIDEPIDDFAELLAAVNDGTGTGSTGTLGRLVNEDSLADALEDGTDAAREGMGSFARFKSWLGLRFEFNFFARQPRFFVTAEVRARTDKFYLVELEKGPLGDFPDDQISDAIGVPEYTRHQVIRDRLRFTAQFGKTFGNWFQVRGGLKESTFGFGADMLLRDGNLRFSADLYGSYQRTPRLKVAGALAVFRSVYLIAGVDDALNEPGYLSIAKGNTDVPIQFDQVRYGRDYFLGATLHFDDADLSMLLRVYGALLVGLL